MNHDSWFMIRDSWFIFHMTTYSLIVYITNYWIELIVNWLLEVDSCSCYITFPLGVHIQCTLHTCISQICKNIMHSHMHTWQASMFYTIIHSTHHRTHTHHAPSHTHHAPLHAHHAHAPPHAHRTPIARTSHTITRTPHTHRTHTAHPSHAHRTPSHAHHAPSHAHNAQPYAQSSTIVPYTTEPCLHKPMFA